MDRELEHVQAAADVAARDDDPTHTLPPESAPAAPTGASVEAGKRLLGSGAALGRYVLLHPIGAGGMGEVHAAYDRRLDRKIALKLLHPKRSGDVEAARLLREAQALARLSHPNVVAVHDVGVFDDGVFVAMEFVDGETLRRWLAAEPRPWRRVVEVLTAAGRGLAAVHAAGLVHRDFKPDNVMIRADGRVLVMDFGLARPVPGAAAPPRGADAPGSAPVERVPSEGLVASALTATGTVVGTPGYMAPEQVRGEPADPRSDQYSFSVVLREALGWTRDGRAPAPSVPRWLRRVIERGAAGRRDDRYPSMEDLLAALASGLGQRRRRLAAALVGLLALGGGGVFVQVEAARSVRCGGGEARVAAVWNGGASEALHASFLATGVPFAEAAWQSVSRGLDRWSGEWVAERRSACEATRLRDEQSPRLLDLRMACYDRRLREVRALVALLADADDQAVENAAEAVERLPRLTSCADTEHLLARVPPPEDPAVRARLTLLEDELSEVRALRDLGRYDAAAEKGRVALASARDLGHPPAASETAYLLAEVEVERGRNAAAEDLLHEALVAAEAGGDDALFGRVAAEMVWVLSVNDSRFSEAERWLRLADAALTRIGDDPELEGNIRAHEGAMLRSAGRLEEAVAPMRRALELDERAHGPAGVEVASSLNNLGTTFADLGRYTEAIAAFERSLAIKESVKGREHPEVAVTLSNLAVCLGYANRYRDALPLEREALSIRQRTLHPNHPSIAKSHANLASMLAEVGLLEEGLEQERVGLEMRRELLGEAHYEIGISYNNLATTYQKLGRHQDALASLDRALSILEGAFGPEHPTVAFALNNQGASLELLGRPEEAIAALERALAIRRAGGVADKDLGVTLFNLARSLHSAGRDPERVRALAEEAVARYRAAGDGYAGDVAATREWIGRMTSAGGAAS